MFNQTKGGRKLSPSADEICTKEHIPEQFDCEVEFNDGGKIRRTVTNITEIYEYIDDWYNAGKTTYTTEDIKEILVKPVGEQKSLKDT